MAAWSEAGAIIQLYYIRYTNECTIFKTDDEIATVT